MEKKAAHPFVGLSKPIEQFQRLLDPNSLDEKRVLWVHGPVGCGKTSMVDYFLKQGGRVPVGAKNDKHLEQVWRDGFDCFSSPHSVLVVDPIEAFEAFYPWRVAQALRTQPRDLVVLVSETPRFYKRDGGVNKKKVVHSIRLFAPWPGQIVSLLRSARRFQIKDACHGDVRKALQLDEVELKKKNGGKTKWTRRRSPFSGGSSDPNLTMFEETSVLLGEQDPPPNFRPSDRSVALAFDNYMGNEKGDDFLFESLPFVERLSALDAAPFQSKHVFKSALKQPTLPFVGKKNRLRFVRRPRGPATSHLGILRHFAPLTSERRDRAFDSVRLLGRHYLQNTTEIGKRKRAYAGLSVEEKKTMCLPAFWAPPT